MIKTQFHKTRMPCFEKAIFIFSLDTELTWGNFRYKSTENFKTDWYIKRKNIKALLQIFDAYNVSSTWAVVGHLFLDNCDGKHKDIKKCDNWQKYDPGTNIKKDPLWYGKDIIKMIKSSKTKHEIACHSFSHTDFDKCPPTVAESELKKCKELFKKENMEMVSFIFPREKHGNYEALKKAGIRVCRKKENKIVKKYKSKILRRILTVLDLVLFFKIEKLENPKEKMKNLWELSAIGNIFVPFNNITTGTKMNRSCLKMLKYLCLLKFYRTVDHAIKNKQIIHVITHPWEIQNKNDIQYIQKMIKYVNKKRNQNKIDILTMQDVYFTYLKNK